jgi:hypothetical protein
MVRRAAALLIPASAWVLWTVGAPHLPEHGRTVALLTAVLVAIPLAGATAITAVAALRRSPPALALVGVAAIGVSVLATRLGSPSAAGVGKLLAAACVGALAARLLDRTWHAALVAVLVIGVDAYSVFAGPTRQLLEHGGDAIGWLTVPLAATGRYHAATLGVTDFFFLSLFAAVVLQWRLRPAITLPLCVASFGGSLVLATAIDRAVPALPLLSLAFLAPNLRRLLPSAPAAAPALDERRFPATSANARRNHKAPPDRAARWRPARDALWGVLDSVIASGATVAIVGAGNCDDVPLTRIAARAERVDLLDVDVTSCLAAIRREPALLRPRLRALAADATGGVADRVVAAIAAGRVPEVPAQDWEPVGEGPYDVVIGDLLYSQLLYPALADAAVPEARIGISLRAYGDAVTGFAVARLHASAPRGVVVHVNDPLAWWDGHDQPFPLARVLAAAASGAEEALALVASGNRPTGCDPRSALAALGIPVVSTTFWRWPFTVDVDYLACATVARTPSR